MKVLAIGNSFSNDAMRYLHGIAKADVVDMKTVNLFIGGCPLQDIMQIYIMTRRIMILNLTV